MLDRLLVELDLLAASRPVGGLVGRWPVGLAYVVLHLDLDLCGVAVLGRGDMVGLVGLIADIPELSRAGGLRSLGCGHTDDGDPLDDLILVRIDSDLGRLDLLRDPGLFCIFVRPASVPCLGPLVGAAGASPVFALAPAATSHEGLTQLLAVAKVEGLVAGLRGGGHIAGIGSKEAVSVRPTPALGVS